MTSKNPKKYITPKSQRLASIKHYKKLIHSDKKGYICHCCDYKTNISYHFKKHIKSFKHIITYRDYNDKPHCIEYNKKLIIKKEYICHCCDYKINSLQSFNKHIKNSMKHKRNYEKYNDQGHCIEYIGVK